MLSYRHGFHAGNAADVLKHFVLSRVLRHLARKNAPIRYVDTHAGAGCYRLDKGFATKNREHAAGIARLWEAGELPPLLAGFLDELATAIGSPDHDRYPGSALLAVSLLRAQDQAWLYDLHPADFQALEETMARRPRGGCRVHVRQEDGFRSLPGLLPPPEGRACVLIDPPYEVKTDYETAARTMAAAWRRMAHGVFVLWYPVVERARIQRLERALVRSEPPNLLRVELRQRADEPGHGMTGSGLFVVNPPWTLRAELETVRPTLLGLLTDRDGGFTVRPIIGDA